MSPAGAPDILPGGPLGRAVRPLWRLDPAVRFLNHGAFGATPLSLLDEQEGWRRRMEANPPRFFMGDLPGLLREAAAALAAVVGARPERLAFVPNATAGTNAVLRSLAFAPGDEIVVTDHAYRAVRNAVQYCVDTAGVAIVPVALGLPCPDDDAVTNAIVGALTPRTRLVVVDHVASASAALLPVAAIAAACRARGVPVLVDGAHAPGLVDLDTTAIGAEWYVGNAHKWLCAPKGAGFIVAAEGAPAIHPLPISHAYGEGFPAEFDRTGTFDPSAVLSVPAAIRLHERLGGAALRARGAALAHRMAARLAAELGTATGAGDGTAMATIRLPEGAPATWDAAAALVRRLRDEHGFEVAVTCLSGALWLRISVAPYTEESDADGLADALAAIGLAPRARCAA